ncbi:alcohol dehydrogenase, putative, partial [Ricinus communis]
APLINESGGFFMRRYEIDTPGSIDGLNLHERPMPTPGANEVVVRVRANSLNAHDLMVLNNAPMTPGRVGLVPLSDGAGEIAAVGAGVKQWRNGDRVVAIFRQNWLAGDIPEGADFDLGGGLDGMAAEYVVLSEEGVLRIPDALSFAEAATLPCAGVTAWNALMSAQLQPGASVLIQGTGGVSLLALQFAKAMGLRVVAITSSAEKMALLQNLGADSVINYREQPDWSGAVREASNGGVDLVVEVGGLATLPISIGSLRYGGRISIVGLLSGFPQSDGAALFGAMFARAATLHPVMVGSRADFADMLRAIEINALHPVIDARRFAFSELPEALHYFARSGHIGKVVVDYDIA